MCHIFPSAAAYFVDNLKEEICPLTSFLLQSICSPCCFVKDFQHWTVTYGLVTMCFVCAIALFYYVKVKKKIPSFHKG